MLGAARALAEGTTAARQALPTGGTINMTGARIETVLAAAFAVLALVTAGSGALEWAIVAGLGILAAATALLARRHYLAARAERTS